MLSLWLAVFLLTMVDFISYRARKKEVKVSERSRWYFAGLVASAMTFPIIVLSSFPLAFAYDFTNVLQGQQFLIFVDVAGYALFFLGALLIFGSKLYLRSMWSYLSAEIKADHKLVTGGVYRIVRHPMYGGVTWMCVGQGLILHNPLLVFYDFLVVMPLWYKCATIEEKLLEKEFSEQYTEYRKRVPMLFPIIQK
jgi:protein-S-isoprenylcysteine O-methyltransferase Ste14